MISSRVVLAAIMGLAALSGCDQGKDEQTKAAGEILEGTVSDAMLKTDQIRSEAPLAPRRAGSGGTARASNASADPSESHPTSEAPVPAASETPEQPAPQPTPEPPPPAE